MRLRLEVVRYQLPPTKILWQAPTEQTISELLHTLDSFIPLESHDWGLEDYVLESSDGFETLHYQTVGSILKDDEQVRIRPLTTYDVRARRLTGRTQIHESGARLVDGIIFGRPLLRKPSRPGIQIASRERLGYGSAGDASYDALALDTLDDGSGDSEYASDSDEPVEIVEGDESDDLDLTSDDVEEDDDEEIPAGAIITVHGTHPRRSQRLLTAHNSRQGEAPERRDDRLDFQQRKEQNSNRHGASGDQGTQLMLENGVSLDSGPNKLSGEIDWNEEIQATPQARPKKRVKLSQKDSNQAQSGQGSAFNLPEECLCCPSSDQSSSETFERATVPPGYGSHRTKSRNYRKTLSRKLRYLKRQNLLPEDAGREELMNYLYGSNEESDITSPQEAVGTTTDEKHAVIVAPRSHSVVSSSGDSSEDASSDEDSSDESSYIGSSGGSSADSGESAPSVETSKRRTDLELTSQTEAAAAELQTDDFQARRKALLSAIANGGVDVTMGVRPVTEENNEDRVFAPGVTTQEPGPRKTKLNIAASQRLVLGSLGHRAPKSASERAALVEKVDAQWKNSASHPANGVADKAEAVPTTDQFMSHDPDYWKSRIELTAVECCDEDVRLSTPPFPFYQRWDPSQQKGKKRKRGHYSYEYHENGNAPYTADNSEQNIALDYDDPVEEDAREDLDGDEFDGFHDGDTDEIDDFPVIPEDLSQLPLVLEADVSPGDILIFSSLEISAATRYEPVMSGIRTARIVNDTFQPGDMLQLCLAKRDQPVKKYDEHGRRIYERFDTIIDELDDGHGDGVLEMMFSDLVEPRLLAKA
ncbi:hypothetical protein ANO11243_054230 [Dothideomycetidae sp. 11243]|nr:hypothetical protein ANO11243_054230 [fungal sp. No.11243]